VDVLESGDGWPILSFHGTGAGNDIFPILERTLIEDGFRLVVPNRPGNYGTPLSCGRTPEEQADLGAELLDRLDIERVAVFGTSGGGLAAPAFAARHPARTVALVLQCALCHPFTSPRWMPRHLRWLYPLFRYQRVFLPVLRVGFRREMGKLRRNPDRVLKDMCGKRRLELRDDPQARELIPLIAESELRCAQQPAGIENDWVNVVGPPWLKPASVRCPTLILHDRADPLVPFAHVEWALHCIPHAEHLDLHAGGHLIWVGKDAERMSKERTAFLRRHFKSAQETEAAG
jgi:pimeloyl-ACP methyl ester carboxylesterase